MFRILCGSLCLIASASIGSIASAQNNLRQPLSSQAPVNNNPPANAAPRTQAPGTTVAVVDIGQLIRNHPGARAKLDALGERAKNQVGNIKQMNSRLQTEAKRLNEMERGSPSAKQLETDLTRQKSEFEMTANLERREIAEAEARLYYDTYTEIQKAVARVSAHHGIQLVLNYDREQIDPNNFDSINRGLRDRIVYQDHLDITDLVQEQIGPVANTAKKPTGGIQKTR